MTPELPGVTSENVEVVRFVLDRIECILWRLRKIQALVERLARSSPLLQGSLQTETLRAKVMFYFLGVSLEAFKAGRYEEALRLVNEAEKFHLREPRPAPWV